MSCMIATKETVSKVSYFIAMLLNQGFNSFGFSVSEYLHQVFDDCRTCGLYDEDMIYNSLYNLNYKAYAGRYRLPIKEDYSDEFPKNPSLRYWDVLERKMEAVGENGRWCEVVQEWHYAAFMGVQFLCYQMNEDITRNEHKVKALEELATRLSIFITCHTPEYHKLHWC